MGRYDVVRLHEGFLADLPIAFNSFRDMDSFVSPVERESGLVTGKVPQKITKGLT